MAQGVWHEQVMVRIREFAATGQEGLARRVRSKCRIMIRLFNHWFHWRHLARVLLDVNSRLASGEAFFTNWKFEKSC
ncbi:MAG: hypothetical protein ACOYB3_07375 [Azonexus sp.]